MMRILIIILEYKKKNLQKEALKKKKKKAKAKAYKEEVPNKVWKGITTRNILDDSDRQREISKESKIKY